MLEEVGGQGSHPVAAQVKPDQRGQAGQRSPVKRGDGVV